MINKVILVGNLGKDPDVKRVKSSEGEVPVAIFSVATSESYKDKQTNEWKDVTEWHRIIAWRNLAEKAEKNLKKGSKVYIEGKITSRSYEVEGVKKNVTEIVASVLMSLDKKTDVADHRDIPLPDADTAYSRQSEQKPKMEQAPVGNISTQTEGIEDDLPF